MKTRASIRIALVGVTSCSLLTRLDGLRNGDLAVEAGTVPPTPDGLRRLRPLAGGLRRGRGRGCCLANGRRAP
jgi:hypothetical protein